MCDRIVCSGEVAVSNGAVGLVNVWFADNEMGLSYAGINSIPVTPF